MLELHLRCDACKREIHLFKCRETWSFQKYIAEKYQRFTMRRFSPSCHTYVHKHTYQGHSLFLPRHQLGVSFLIQERDTHGYGRSRTLKCWRPGTAILVRWRKQHPELLSFRYQMNNLLHHSSTGYPTRIAPKVFLAGTQGLQQVEESDAVVLREVEQQSPQDLQVLH